MKKKRPFTLLEIMVVIFLIGLIGSVVGYNMKGSLDKGKAFKTEQALNQLEDLFDLQISQGYDIADIVNEPKKYLIDAGVSKPENLLTDGWGKRFLITENNKGIKIVSASYDKWKAKKEKQNLQMAKEEE